ncbi:MAG: hydroxyacid dehydrogenase [Rhodothermales bacterium]|nr:hydroxyacid dehydrogenase [Rhodothermales bacterium]
MSTLENKGYVYEAASLGAFDGQPRPDVCGLILSLEKFIGRQELSNFQNLRFLLSATTGQDHLDLSALDEQGVELITLRGHDDFLATITSTPEHTWALLLAMVRNLPDAIAHVESGGWDRDRFRGRQLSGMRLGVVGLGRVGSRVAAIGEAFGMDVAYFDPHVSRPVDRYDSLEDLAARSDVVTIHVHLNETTANLLDENVIRRLPAGAFIVNTSRGLLIDEAVAAEHVLSGALGGVAVDVLADELDETISSPLRRARELGANVLITPHIAGASWDAMQSCEDFVALLAPEAVRLDVQDEVSGERLV